MDGEEAPILRADFLFRAVALPPGTHQVRFVFQPASLERGVMLSFAGVGIAVSAILVGVVGPLLVRVGRRQSWARLRQRPPADS